MSETKKPEGAFGEVSGCAAEVPVLDFGATGEGIEVDTGVGTFVAIVPGVDRDTNKARIGVKLTAPNGAITSFSLSMEASGALCGLLAEELGIVARGTFIHRVDKESHNAELSERRDNNKI